MPSLFVIPARLGATRLPRKPLRLLGGVPLVVRVWERVAAMGLAARVVVATDAEEVADACRTAGADVAMTAPDLASGTDRVAAVAGRPEFAGFDVIVNVQGDEPYLTVEAVRESVGLVASGRFPVGTAAAVAPPEVLAQPEVVKVVADDGGRALYFSRAPIPFLRDAADRGLRDSLVRQHLGVYAYRPEALRRWVALPPHPLELAERLEQLRALAAGIPIGVATVAPVAGGGIDTEADLARANATWLSLTTAGPH